MMRAGVAVTDITPPSGLAMSGFAARTEHATGAHDRLTARAIAVNDTAIVAVDVIGLHHQMSERIRARCVLRDDNVILAAVHNHGGPASMAGRLGAEADRNYLLYLEDRCVEAIDSAVASQVLAELLVGQGGDPDIARNRRHASGLVDPSLPVLRIRDSGGRMLAVMTSYACHPVVLGADNRQWTADYPHFVRLALEETFPGATAVFLTGCCADANTGHSAHASISLAANDMRTFARAEQIGRKIAACATASTGETRLGDWARCLNTSVTLQFCDELAETPTAMARRWSAKLDNAEPGRAAVLRNWIAWAETTAGKPKNPLVARVSALDWGGLPILAMPGEIFAETSLTIRARGLGQQPGFVLAFAEDNPGYLPPASEYAAGGYEVEEAHRFYGQPNCFARGSAELLAAASAELAADFCK